MRTQKNRRKGLTGILTGLLAGVMAIGSMPFATPVQAAPSKTEAELAYESLTSFADSMVLLAGESVTDTVHILDSSYHFNHELDYLSTGYIGYQIQDLDGDGCVEMATLYQDWNGTFDISVESALAFATFCSF